MTKLCFCLDVRRKECSLRGRLWKGTPVRQAKKNVEVDACVPGNRGEFPFQQTKQCSLDLDWHSPLALVQVSVSRKYTVPREKNLS